MKLDLFGPNQLFKCEFEVPEETKQISGGGIRRKSARACPG